MTSTRKKQQLQGGLRRTTRNVSLATDYSDSSNSGRNEVKCLIVLRDDLYTVSDVAMGLACDGMDVSMERRGTSATSWLLISSLLCSTVWLMSESTSTSASQIAVEKGQAVSPCWN